MTESVPSAIDAFNTRRENSGAAERANFQMFFSELTDILEVRHDELDEPVLETYGWLDLKEAPHSCGAIE